MAAALTSGQVILEDFTDKKVKDPVRQALTAKCSYIHPDGWGVGMNEPKVEVTITLNNGHEFSELVGLPKGEPENPLTDEELLSKFKNCAGVILKEKEIDRLYETVMNIDNLVDISEITRITSANLD